MEKREETGLGEEDALSGGVHILNWAGDRSLDGLRVVVHELSTSEGLGHDDDVERFTEMAAWYLGREHATPVATRGDLTVVAPTELSRSVTVWGQSVSPRSREAVTLDASSPRGRGQLKALVQTGLRLAISAEEYEVPTLDRVVSHTPALRSEDEKFALYPKFDLTVDVPASGTPLLHVEAGHTVRTTQVLADTHSPGDDVSGITVEHDTTVYDDKSRGTVQGWSDYRYTDHVPGLDQSVASYHEGLLNEQMRQELIGQNPRLVRVKYGPGFEGHQAPQILRRSVREEDVQEANPEFYRQYQAKKSLLPDDRVSYARSFISDLSRIPVLDFDFSVGNGPDSTGYDCVPIREGGRRLAFGDQSLHSVPTEGLREHGVFSDPGDYSLGVLAPSRVADLGEEITQLLLKGLQEVGAPTRTRFIEYELGATSDYTEQAAQIRGEIDCALVLVPDEDQVASFDMFDDPFDELKQTLMRGGVASQMLQKSTADDLSQSNADLSNEKFANILSALVAKAGGTPWQIADLPGETDAFLGLDVTYDSDTGQHTGASASVVLADGTTYAAESTTTQGGEEFSVDDVRQFIRELVFDHGTVMGESIEHVTLLRDGRMTEDVETIRTAAQEMNLEADVVAVRKSGQPRIVEYDASRRRLDLADKGVAFVDRDRDRSVLLSWGPPEVQLSSARGTPRTLGIRHHSGPSDIETLTRQVYWLSEVHVGSPARSGRNPVPIEYADKAAEYVRDGFVSSGQVIHGPAYL
ncbi:Piwi domain-containing protein [Halobaculum sp. MBLA0143]|uniref:Piwi domain-containing protein n=1 Tax=Halobaculum sp. MBLA0143 TaxID=3079933 RepID=UPI003523918E